MKLPCGDCSEDMQAKLKFIINKIGQFHVFATRLPPKFFTS